MQALPLGDLSATPWSFSPVWFLALALAIPALVWLSFAWRRAVLECPNRIRRAGVREMRRLLKSLQRADVAPKPSHLHAWLRATARVWNVRTSAPCISEVSQSAQALTGDANVTSRWGELWQATEHGLYAADARPTPDWVTLAADAAASVAMPKRERFFPNRLGHWLPTLAVALFVIVGLAPPTTDADVPWSAPPPSEPSVETQISSDDTARSEAAAAAETRDGGSGSTAVSADVTNSEMVPSDAAAEDEATPVVLSADVQQAAQTALKSHWNDWAAHHNLAAYQIQEGELNLAIAHATAAFVQHPAGTTTRDTLLAAFGETPGVDPGLLRLLSGAWYERVPTLLSPSGWQRLALLAGLIVAAGFSVMIFALYVPRGAGRVSPAALSWAGRGSLAFGALLLVISLGSWNAYGALNQPSAAILLQSANVTPVPTDLVPVEETSPLAAGAIVVTHRTFLGWREVTTAPETSGWVRSNAVMPLYAAR